LPNAVAQTYKDLDVFIRGDGLGPIIPSAEVPVLQRVSSMPTMTDNKRLHGGVGVRCDRAVGFRQLKNQDARGKKTFQKLL
jgi:hypothetical protein